MERKEQTGRARARRACRPRALTRLSRRGLLLEGEGSFPDTVSKVIQPTARRSSRSSLEPVVNNFGDRIRVTKQNGGRVFAKRFPCSAHAIACLSDIHPRKARSCRKESA